MVIRRFRPKTSNRSTGQFEQLIEPHFKHLYQLAYCSCNNQSDAEDLVQDVVVKLLPRTTEMARIEKLRPGWRGLFITSLLTVTARMSAHP